MTNYQSTESGFHSSLRDYSTERGYALYSREYALNADAVHEQLRSTYGPIAPVELAPPANGYPGVQAMLVVGYREAVDILNNPSVFSKDPRNWKAMKEGLIPSDSPVLPMMAYRPNALFTDGAEHKRLREAVIDSLNKIDRHVLQKHVEDAASYLIGIAKGSDRINQIDLLHSYAKMLPLIVFVKLFGCTEKLADRLVEAITGIFDSGPNADRANEELGACLNELVTLKRNDLNNGYVNDDVTTWLMKHESNLSDAEMVNQLVMLMSAGTEPERNLIANGLKLILSDNRYSTSLFGEGPTIQDALSKVMWDEPPMTNYAVHYPRHDTHISDIVLRQGIPVVIGIKAANADPVIRLSGHVYESSAHLGFSAGPHTCPAKGPAWMIAQIAIERILNWIPDLSLTVPHDQLAYRPGPFTLGLTALPARFSPDPYAVDPYPVQNHQSVKSSDAQSNPKAPVAPLSPEQVAQDIEKEQKLGLIRMMGKWFSGEQNNK